MTDFVERQSRFWHRIFRVKFGYSRRAARTQCAFLAIAAALMAIVSVDVLLMATHLDVVTALAVMRRANPHWHRVLPLLWRDSVQTSVVLMLSLITLRIACSPFAEAATGVADYQTPGSRLRRWVRLSPRARAGWIAAGAFVWIAGLNSSLWLWAGPGGALAPPYTYTTRDYQSDIFRHTAWFAYVLLAWLLANAAEERPVAQRAEGAASIERPGRAAEWWSESTGSSDGPGTQSPWSYAYVLAYVFLTFAGLVVLALIDRTRGLPGFPNRAYVWFVLVKCIALAAVAIPLRRQLLPFVGLGNLTSLGAHWKALLVLVGLFVCMAVFAWARMNWNTEAGVLAAPGTWLRRETALPLYAVVGLEGLIAIIEEVFYRGLLLGTLASRMERGRAMLWSAAIFYAMHLFVSVPDGPGGKLFWGLFLSGGNCPYSSMDWLWPGTSCGPGASSDASWRTFPWTPH